MGVFRVKKRAFYPLFFTLWGSELDKKNTVMYIQLYIQL